MSNQAHYPRALGKESTTTTTTTTTSTSTTTTTTTTTKSLEDSTELRGSRVKVFLFYNVIRQVGLEKIKKKNNKKVVYGPCEHFVLAGEVTTMVLDV